MTRKPKAAAAPADPRLAERNLGYVFTDETLLINALTHVSSLKATSRRADSYQRLEFLGDHVLGLIVSDMLYRAFPEADEGELSKRLADLVRKETCADVASSIGLDAAVKVGGVGAGADERLRRAILGDVCEAVIGAIYLDGGHGAAADVVGRLWGPRLRRPMRALRDPKTVLQEWAQGRGLPTPVYREIDRSGPHHNPRFRVAVELPGLAPADGDGGSKRAAEKAAAKAMLEREGVTGPSADV
jgi:ribonuclease-3